ncbi:hypothetical protein COOONC_21280 [Cooperia oncophora]
MELGLDEDEAKERAEQTAASSGQMATTSSTGTVEPEQSPSQQPEEAVDQASADEKLISDEALIDAMFSEVLDGEASEVKKKLEKLSSFDNWYDQPEAHEDDEEVEEYVSDLLSQSMSEAIFSASKCLKKESTERKRGLLITDTSFDKPLIQKLKGESVEDEDGQVLDGSKKSAIVEVDEENQGEDPILKAVFTSKIENPQFLESVISYPPSMNSPRYTSSTITTPGTAKTKDDADVFFASQPSPVQANDADTTYVSSASVMMNDTHSSSEGDYDDDHIIKLVFSELPDKAKRGAVKSVETARVRLPNMETMEETMEESCQTPNSSVDSEVSALSNTVVSF